MDTVPLLTPTMESELLKNPWVFPQPKTNAKREEEGAASTVWEENFQDLSGWCMDTLQGQCDFHAGESPTLKLSGTKYEGNRVLSPEEGVLKDLMSVPDREKWNTKITTAGTREHLTNNNCHDMQPASDVTCKHEKDDSTAESNAPRMWSRLSKGSSSPAAASPSSWGKQSNTDVSTPFQSRYQIEDVKLNDASPASFDLNDNQRETWDMLGTIETTGSDAFDLLSYLCDDEMRSPEGSVSTDSSVISKPWSPATTTSSTTILPTGVKVKTETDEMVGRRYTKTRAASTITTSSMGTPVVSPRRTERTRTQVTSKAENNCGRVRREKLGRKRHAEPEPEKTALHYRESREKNNEASRKSRMNKKAKETEMATMAVELERDNRILKMKVEELEKLVTSMRSALLRSALKKEF